MYVCGLEHLLFIMIIIKTLQTIFESIKSNQKQKKIEMEQKKDV